MSKIIDAIEKLEKILPLKPATEEDVKNVETALELSLANDYKEYVCTYGAILADKVELTGIAKSKNRNVVQVTKKEWELNDKIEHNLYVIENIGIDGLIIWQDGSGKIYESRPNHRATKIANSLAEYLESK